MTIKCSRCGMDERYDLEVKRCPKCGADLAEQAKAREERRKSDDALKGAIGRIR